MNKKAKILLGSGIALAGGLAAFLYIRKRKRKKMLYSNPNTNYTSVSGGKKKKVQSNQVILERGSRGEDVKKLQQLLNKIGNAGLKVDGKFGEKTEKALVKIANSKIVTPSLMLALVKKAMNSFV